MATIFAFKRDHKTVDVLFLVGEEQMDFVYLQISKRLLCPFPHKATTNPTIWKRGSKNKQGNCYRQTCQALTLPCKNKPPCSCRAAFPLLGILIHFPFGDWEQTTSVIDWLPINDQKNNWHDVITSIIKI
jgi:hypothetical protein